MQVARLRALHDYGILDTPREPDFDDIVRLASQICGTAISVVNLIDAERQWFKAEVGLGVRETPLETSICAHAILEEDFVEINDTLTDHRLCDNPLVIGDGGLRFYAGALLRSSNGLPIGTLCVLDHAPRELTALQRDAVRILARQVMTQLDLRRALVQATILRREVDHRVKNSLTSLASMARIQARRASPDAAKALHQMEARIETVAMLHELLYKTDAGGDVDLGAYMTNIAGYLGSVLPPGVHISSNGPRLSVTSRQAALIGTLINEFVANSIKHAFPDDRGGHITLTLTEPSSGDRARLCLSDDGIGMSPDGPKGLGSTILLSIAQQLGAELDVGSLSGGTRLVLDFTPDKAGVDPS